MHARSCPPCTFIWQTFCTLNFGFLYWTQRKNHLTPLVNSPPPPINAGVIHQCFQNKFLKSWSTCRLYRDILQRIEPNEYNSTCMAGDNCWRGTGIIYLDVFFPKKLKIQHNNRDRFVNCVHMLCRAFHSPEMNSSLKWFHAMYVIGQGGRSSWGDLYIVLISYPSCCWLK